MTAKRVFQALLCLVTMCGANPESWPDAQPHPEPIAHAQAYTNNAPFSGAVYIVYPDGQAVTAQGTNMCPSYASVSCGPIQQPSWCCPGGYSCASPANANGLIGCCPSANTCGGAVNVASVTTVTVYAQPQPTVAVYNQPTQVAAGGFCQTLTMTGPDLPRVTQGACGTILIVNDGSRNLRPSRLLLVGILLFVHNAHSWSTGWV